VAPAESWNGGLHDATPFPFWIVADVHATVTAEIGTVMQLPNVGEAPPLTVRFHTRDLLPLCVHVTAVGVGELETNGAVAGLVAVKLIVAGVAVTMIVVMASGRMMNAALGLGAAGPGWTAAAAAKSVMDRKELSISNLMWR
jgi:hypothetical protein